MEQELGATNGEGEGLNVGDTNGITEGMKVGNVGETEGTNKLGETLGIHDGMILMVGVVVGFIVGSHEGFEDGSSVGSIEGREEGGIVGIFDGLNVG